MDEVKTLIRSLLTSTPLAMNIQQLLKEYRSETGSIVPFREFGFSSLEQFLRSMPDVVQVKNTGPLATLIVVRSEKSAHIDQLVNKQKVIKTKKNAYSMERKYISQPPIPTNTNHYSTDQPKFKSKPFYGEPDRSYQHRPRNSNYQSQHTYERPRVNWSNNNATETQTKPDVQQSRLQPDPHNNYPQTSGVNSKLDSESQALKQALKLPVDPSKNTPKLQAEPSKQAPKLQYHIQPDSSYVVPPTNNIGNTEEQKVHKIKYNLQTRPTTLQEMNKLHSKNKKQESERETVELTRENLERLQMSLSRDGATGGGAKVKKVVTHKALTEPVRTDVNIPFTVKHNLKVLIEKFPDGIWCAELPGNYKKLFRSELRFQELGFRSLIELCSSLPSVFHYVRPSTGDYKLYDGSKPLPKCAEKNDNVAGYDLNKSVAQIEALPAFDWNDIDYLLPDGIFPLGEEIPRINIFNKVKVDDEIKLAPGEVYDISKFWVYLADGCLPELMRKLQDFYQRNADKYLISKNLAAEGLYCVCIFAEEYHRALIVNVFMDEGFVRVFYIDYGTTGRVPISGIYFLHKDFSTTPAQAIRCRLAHIRPIVEGAPWSRNANNRFRDLFVEERKYMGKIVNVNSEEMALQVYLCDVTDPDEELVYINQQLVNERLAIYTDQTPVRKLDKPNAIVKYLHMLPTFEELEIGLAPSTEDMQFLQSHKLPLELLLPQCFQHDHSDELRGIDDYEKFYSGYLGTAKKSKRLDNATDVDSEPFNYGLFKGLEEEIRKITNEGIGIVGPETEVCAKPAPPPAPPAAAERNDQNSSLDQSQIYLNLVEELKKDCFEICNEININITRNESSCCNYDDEINSILEDDEVLEELDQMALETSIMSRKSEARNVEMVKPVERYHPTNPFLTELQNEDVASLPTQNTFTKLNLNNPFLSYVKTETATEHTPIEPVNKTDCLEQDMSVASSDTCSEETGNCPWSPNDGTDTQHTTPVTPVHFQQQQIQPNFTAQATGQPLQRYANPYQQQYYPNYNPVMYNQYYQQQPRIPPPPPGFNNLAPPGFSWWNVYNGPHQQQQQFNAMSQNDFYQAYNQRRLEYLKNMNR